MKPLLKTLYIITLMMCRVFCIAQQNNTRLSGQLTNALTHKPIAAVVVTLACQGDTIFVTSNDSGYYFAGSLKAGAYTISALPTFNTAVTDVSVRNNTVSIINIPLYVSKERPLGYGANVCQAHIMLIEPTMLKPNERDDRLALTIHGGCPAAIVYGVIETDWTFIDYPSSIETTVYYVDGELFTYPVPFSPNSIVSYTDYNGFIPPRFGGLLNNVVEMGTYGHFSAVR